MPVHSIRFLEIPVTPLTPDPTTLLQATRQGCQTPLPITILFLDIMQGLSPQPAQIIHSLDMAQATQMVQVVQIRIFGKAAGYFNTTGIANTCIGYAAGYGNTGSSNTFVGYRTGQNNTTGFSNVAIGTAALFWSTTASQLVAIGDSALYNQGTRGDGNYFNTASARKPFLPTRQVITIMQSDSNLCFLTQPVLLTPPPEVSHFLKIPLGTTTLQADI
jgi:hypothetical protein